MSLVKEKISDHCEITSSKRIFYSEYVKTGVPFYRSKEIIEKSQGQKISEPLYIQPEKYREIKGKFGVPEPDDMLLTSVGTIGIPYIVKHDDYFYFKDGNLTWFRNFDDKLLSRYLYYWICSAEGRGVLNNTTIGSSQKALTISALKNITISLPSIETQIKVVDILSAYDDLIENNQKQINLLEEAAQRIYIEWFVDLRFPGYEKIPFKEGLPDGWKKGRADSFFEITIGKTPPRSQNQWFTDMFNGIAWASISDMGKSYVYLGDTEESLTSDAIKRHNVKIVPEGTVLLSFKLTVGRVAIANQALCTNEAIAHFYIPDQTIREYVYCYLKLFPYDTLGSTSSISKAINSKIIKSMSFIMPNSDILAKFSKVARPIFDEIRNKVAQNRLLLETRDRLLPKLMSGVLEV